MNLVEPVSTCAQCGGQIVSELPNGYYCVKGLIINPARAEMGNWSGKSFSTPHGSHPDGVKWFHQNVNFREPEPDSIWRYAVREARRDPKVDLSYEPSQKI